MKSALDRNASAEDLEAATNRLMEEWQKVGSRMHQAAGGGTPPPGGPQGDPGGNGFFRTIRRGFFVADQKGIKFYRFPSLRQLEVEHAHWWRSASMR